MSFANTYRSVRKKVPLYTLIIGVILVLTIVSHIISICNETFADFMTVYVNAPIRWTLAKITDIFSFSVAEFIIIFMPVMITAVIIFLIRITKKDDRRKQSLLLFALVSILALIYILFVLTLGCAYHGSTLDEKMKLNRNKVSPEELALTCEKLNEGINECIDEIGFVEGSSSVMPYSLKELNTKLNKVYAQISREYNFVSKLSSNVKPIILSKAMTYTHISGVYSFFTGEANINVNYPDYIIPFTMAHEMAHQRGIAREDEANFVAFLVCIESDDPYIRYSGYTQIIEYTLSALSKADKDAYKKAYSALDTRYKSEISAFNDFMDKYEKNVAATVSSAVNNTYQQIQGQKAGIQSYGLVVDLAVAYYKAENAK